MSENTANAGNQTVEGTGSENPAAEGSRTFTQEEVNSMLANERRSTEAKFKGYEDCKAKAEEYDKQQEASKSELEFWRSDILTGNQTRTMRFRTCAKTSLPLWTGTCMAGAYL